MTAESGRVGGVIRSIDQPERDVLQAALPEYPWQ